MWILQLAGYVLGAAGVVIVVWRVPRLVHGWAYDWRHAKHLIAEVQRADWGAGYEQIGSMSLADEQAYRHQLIPRDEWNDSTTESGGGWDQRTALFNGHTFGCLRPDEEHPGACPEEGDWPDDHDWPLPDVPSVEQLAARPGVVDRALAFEAEDPADAGWTGELLAELHNAPTALDEIWADRNAGRFDSALAGPGSDHPLSGGPGPATLAGLERLADTGEIHLAGLRADWAAELDDQDADAADFISRLKSDAAGYQLSVTSPG